LILARKRSDRYCFEFQYFRTPKIEVFPDFISNW
jgi:hypothetical protein